MSKKFINLSELDTTQEYRIESEGARTRMYGTRTYNLRGVKDHFLYRRVISNTSLRKNIEFYGLGITIQLLERLVKNGFDIVNLKVTKIPEKFKQGELF